MNEHMTSKAVPLITKHETRASSGDVRRRDVVRGGSIHGLNSQFGANSPVMALTIQQFQQPQKPEDARQWHGRQLDLECTKGGYPIPSRVDDAIARSSMASTAFDHRTTQLSARPAAN